MPKFKYKAQDENGKKFSGTLYATNESDLHAKLRADNKYLVSCQEQILSTSTKQLKAAQITDFCRQLGMLLSAGVSLVRALGIVVQNESLTEQEKRIYEELLRHVKQGIPLSDSLEMQGEVFPPLLVNMVRASESTGSLDKTVMRMAYHYEKDHKLAGKLKSSMAYPKVLIGMIVIVLVVIMEYVLPQFDPLFSQMPELPLMTRILIGISDFVKTNFILLAAFAGGIYLAFNFARTFPAVQIALDKSIVHLPKVGMLMKQVFTARFARALSSLYSAGVPIVSSLTIARKTVGNSYIESQFDASSALVRNGGSLSTAIRMIDGFSNKLSATIEIGEETGSLDEMLDSIADTLEYDSEIAINSLTTYIEPVMIIILGVIVVLIVIGVIMPIYQSYDFIGQAENIFKSILS